MSFATPNAEQVKDSLRWIVSTFGGMVAGWFAAKGYFTIDQVTTVLNSPALISGAASLVMLIIGLFVHTETNAVAVVDKIAKDPESPVKGVITTSTPEGQELAESIPGMTTVPAGTPAAMSLVSSI